jgi:hypothetical protein
MKYVFYLRIAMNRRYRFFFCNKIPLMPRTISREHLRTPHTRYIQKMPFDNRPCFKGAKLSYPPVNKNPKKQNGNRKVFMMCRKEPASRHYWILQVKFLPACYNPRKVNTPPKPEGERLPEIRPAYNLSPSSSH